MEQFPGRLYTLSLTLTCCCILVGKMKAVLALEEKGREGQERKEGHLEDLKARELDKIAQRTKVRACINLSVGRGLGHRLAQQGPSWLCLWTGELSPVLFMKLPGEIV